MLAILLFADVSRCASTAWCPSDAQLIAAIRARRESLIPRIAKEEDVQDPANIHLIESERIVGIRDVRCGQAQGSEVKCSFAVKYVDHSTPATAQLKRYGSGWIIVTGRTLPRLNR